jgi:hypothetical protein
MWSLSFVWLRCNNNDRCILYNPGIKFLRNKKINQINTNLQLGRPHQIDGIFSALSVDTDNQDRLQETYP